VDRRAFIGQVGSLITAPLTAEAEQPLKVRRFGFLATNLAGNPRSLEAFQQGRATPVMSRVTTS
jgi:hypothetical protein